MATSRTSGPGESRHTTESDSPSTDSTPTTIARRERSQPEGSSPTSHAHASSVAAKTIEPAASATKRLGDIRRGETRAMGRSAASRTTVTPSLAARRDAIPASRVP
ncbi:MAG: hypothetical protein M5U28_36825 [Sandaracinaceae bacterium]|nr:hypothetical protein [Sandaracinaceae bacterium]